MACVRVGHPDRARELLSPELVANAPIALRARAQIVLGLASRAAGEFNDALGHLQLAVRLSSRASPNLEEAAWAQLHLLRHMLDSGNVEIAAGDGSNRASSCSTKLGQPQTTAYLHVVIAAMEGQRGRLDEGWRHCDIATSVLKLAPNAWLTVVLRSQVSIAVSQCRTARCAELIRSLRELSRSATRSLESSSRTKRTLVTSNSVVATTYAVRERLVESLSRPAPQCEPGWPRWRVWLVSVSLRNELGHSVARIWIASIPKRRQSDANLLHTTAVRWAACARRDSC